MSTVLLAPGRDQPTWFRPASLDRRTSHDHR